MIKSSYALLFSVIFLLFAQTASAASVYYVANLGNDACNGLSQVVAASGTCAWKTIAKVNAATLSPGDSVLFNKGDTWNEALSVTASGTVGNPITFGAYGTGTLPSITGLTTLGNSWVNMGGNIWRYDVSAFLASTTIRYLLLNGVNQKMTQSPVRYANSGTTGSFIDIGLGGLTGDYVGSEVVMRSTSYTWDIRTVTAYNATTEQVSFTPNNSYGLHSVGDSVGGYFFQNSLIVLQHNAAPNEWAHSGNFLYYYSLSDPNTLGTIQVSSINKLVNLGSSPYITIAGIKFSYANQFCIWGNGGNNKSITDSTFDHCNTGIFENNKLTANSRIDNNIFTDIGSIAVYQYYATNLTLTNNTITNVGLDIGRMPYVGDFGFDSMWYSAVVLYPNGGLLEYNNIRNTGYIAFLLEMPSNHALVQHNYVADPCIQLTDCGAYYVFDGADTSLSNVDKITFRGNIAAVTNSTTTKWLTGYVGNTYGWATNGFYKDGFVRATNWDGNFAYGFTNQFFSNPAKYSTWTNNTGIVVPTLSGSRAFYINDIASSTQYSTNNIITGNIIANAINNYELFFLYDAQLLAPANNTVDYNTILRPNNSWRGGMVYTYPSLTTYSFEQYKAIPTVGIHEDTGNFFLAQTGIASTTEMVWITTNPTKATSTVVFPAGYRYYTPSGDPLASDVIAPYQGKIYFRTINQGMPQASSTSITGGSFVGSMQTGTYAYGHEQGNTEFASTYQWYRSSDGTKEARVPIVGATGLTYTTTGADYGKYIIFGVIPKSAVGVGSLLTGVERFSAAKVISSAVTDKSITAFNFTAPAVVGVVNEAAKTVTLTVPFGTNISNIIPSITISGMVVAPDSGVAQTFLDGIPVNYTVMAADASTQVYAVTVYVAPNPNKVIYAYDFNALIPKVTGVINENGKAITLGVPYGTDLSNLVPTIGLHQVNKLSSGSYAGYALKTDGSLWSWGYDAYGQLGLGTTTDRHLPTQVSTLSGIVDLAGGYYSGYALKSDGTIWSWGRNDFGQVGDGTVLQKNSPVKVSGLTGVTGISGGYYAAYARKSDGTVWAWGGNGSGQLGNNSTATSSIPVQVSGLTNVATTTAGYFSGYAIKSDGTVWSWGNNTEGELGNNSVIQSNVPVQVSGLTNVLALATGRYSAYALKSDGTVWSWGGNTSGQLGNASTTQSNIPVQVSGLTNVIGIAAGRMSAYALKSDGTVWSWGDNGFGQLGNNSIVQSNIPVQVSGLLGISTLGASGGTYSGYALTSDGSVWSWGNNQYGQLGNNLTTQSNVPVEILTLKKSTVSPASGVAHTFVDGIPSAYTVTAVDTTTQAYAVTVNVAPATNYTLNIMSAGGTVSQSPHQSSYASGTVVALMATPSSGYRFSGWTGAVTSSVNPINITMDANKSVTANYSTISSVGGGGGSGSTPIAPVVATEGVTTTEGPDGTTLHFTYSKGSLITVIGRDAEFDSRIVMLSTNSLLWTDKTSKTLYVMYCSITAACSRPISVKVNTGKVLATAPAVPVKTTKPSTSTAVTKPVVPAPPPTAGNANAFVFTHDLSYGMKSPEVLNLQRFLNAHGVTIIKSGPGSPGNETNYFGYATMMALKKFQLSHAKELYGKAVTSSAVGSFGRVTRELVNKMQ